MKSIEEIHRAIFGANEDDEELTALKDELERTKKQLEIATKCINWVIDTFQKGLEHESDVVGCCELSLERIEDLEQKD